MSDMLSQPGIDGLEFFSGGERLNRVPETLVSNEGM